MRTISGLKQKILRGKRWWLSSDSHWALLGRPRLRRVIASTKSSESTQVGGNSKSASESKHRWEEGLAGRWLLCPEAVVGLEVLEEPKFEEFVVQENADREDSDFVDLRMTISLVSFVTAACR